MAVIGILITIIIGCFIVAAIGMGIEKNMKKKPNRDGIVGEIILLLITIAVVVWRLTHLSQ